MPKPEKLAEVLTMHAFENETLEKKGNDYLLGIDVLPDRAGDCLSHTGIARECSALLGLRMAVPSVRVKEDKKLKTKSFLSVKVENPDDCRRYTARVVSGVKVAPSPKWLRERLEICGLNSINNVVDATNYVMLETGQPLHAFDYSNINGGIFVRRARKGEKIRTLSGKDYDLDANTLVIADGKKPLALAGIKGGADAGIADQTDTIVIESANFNPKLISQTARRLNLRTDASIRYEHNLDPNLTEAAMERVASLISELAGGRVAAGLIDVYPKKVKPKKIRLDLANLNRIIGAEISEKEVIRILSKLRMKALPVKGGLAVEVPTFRQDIVIPENLIEEVGRVYGYDKIKNVLPYSYLAPAARNEELFWQNKAKDAFKELGFTEVYTYSLIGDEEKDLFHLETEEVLNPVSAFFKYLRPTLLPQMAKTAKENLKFFDELRIFELSKVFIKDKGVTEKMMLAGAVYGHDFYHLKDCLNILFDSLNIKKASYEPVTDNGVWHAKKTAQIKIAGDLIGHVGALSPDISDISGIDSEIYLFELDFDKVQQYASEDRNYEPISYHPPATRDISGIVGDELKIEYIAETINDNGGELLKSVESFDVYKGKGIPAGKKSVSFHLVYQSDKKTLDTETIDALIDNLIARLKESFNWEERK